MLKTLQNFYKAVVTTGLETGTGSCYVSVLPTPSAGYLVINPSNVTKREIVAYSGTGTDEGGSYVTLTTRGVGGTTEQAHDVNEPVRLNLTAEYYAEIQDEIDVVQTELDQAILAGAGHASTTNEGIVYLSVAAAESGTPIVVGTNDPRLTSPTGQPSAFVSVSTGSADAGSGVVLNANGVLDPSFTNTAPTIQVFTSSGTWTKPAGLKAVIVEVVGGGGSGASSGDVVGGGGGGGGGYARKRIAVSGLESSTAVTVGGATQTSSFGSYCSATGGSNASGANGGSGGVGSGGDVNIKGGGGNAGATDASASPGGSGGSSVLGGGGKSSSGNVAGEAGGNYGGGGGGGGADGSGSSSGAGGGAGAGGIVIVTEYYN